MRLVECVAETLPIFQVAVKVSLTIPPAFSQHHPIFVTDGFDPITACENNALGKYRKIDVNTFSIRTVAGREGLSPPVADGAARASLPGQAWVGELLWINVGSRSVA